MAPPDPQVFSYGSALLSLALLGIQRFLYKVAAEFRCDTAQVTFAFMGTVTALAVLSFLIRGVPVENGVFLLIVGAVNGVAFFAATTTTMEALKHLPAAVVYPVARLNVLVVVVFSVVFFKDRFTLVQAAGILTAVGVITLLTRREASETGGESKDRKKGFALLAVALLSGAAAAISSKFAAGDTDLFAFMTVSYGIGALLSLLQAGAFRRTGPPGTLRRSLILGFTMGIFNFAGFFSFLKALQGGPLSLVAPITGLHFVVAIVLSAALFRERLTSGRVAGVLLTVAAVFLLRF